MNRDPIGYGGGLNLYGYVVGMPTYWVDPFGFAGYRQDPFTGEWYWDSSPDFIGPIFDPDEQPDGSPKPPLFDDPVGPFPNTPQYPPLGDYNPPPIFDDGFGGQYTFDPRTGQKISYPGGKPIGPAAKGINTGAVMLEAVVTVGGGPVVAKGAKAAGNAAKSKLDDCWRAGKEWWKKQKPKKPRGRKPKMERLEDRVADEGSGPLDPGDPIYDPNDFFDIPLDPPIQLPPNQFPPPFR